MNENSGSPPNRIISNWRILNAIHEQDFIVPKIEQGGIIVGAW